MSSTQEKQESEMSKYTAGYDSGLEGEQSMLCITRHDKEQDTIVAMYRGEEADIIQAAIDSAKREGAIEEVKMLQQKAEFMEQAGMNFKPAAHAHNRLIMLEQSEESEQ